MKLNSKFVLAALTAVDLSAPAWGGDKKTEDNKAGADARKASLDEFKLPPAALPVALLGGAETFLATLEPFGEAS